MPGVIRRFSGCLGGEVYRGHVEAWPEIREYLRVQDFRTLFVYRDLRDAVVSLLYWWEQNSETDNWPFRYFRELQSGDERLTFLIEGWPEKPKLPGFPDRVEFPDIATRFSAFQPWINEQSCLAVRFEELRNPETRDEACRRIIAHLITDSSEMSLESMVNRMIAGSDSKRSRTFRKGSGGEWRSLFTKDHIEPKVGS